MGIEIKILKKPIYIDVSILYGMDKNVYIVKG